MRYQLNYALQWFTQLPDPVTWATQLFDPLTHSLDLLTWHTHLTHLSELGLLTHSPDHLIRFTYLRTDSFCSIISMTCIHSHIYPSLESFTPHTDTSAKISQSEVSKGHSAPLLCLWGSFGKVYVTCFFFLHAASSNSIFHLWMNTVRLFHTLWVHYAHAAANLNWPYSKYTKVARVHYFCTIALPTHYARVSVV